MDFLETLYRIYSISGYNIAHIDVTAKLCAGAQHHIPPISIALKAVVNCRSKHHNIPAPHFPPVREDIGELAC